MLRHPGGDSATEMLQAAVDASRVIHPNLVGVYDAIDEGERAYVVREWVDGEALRELVGREGPLDPARATAIAHSIADALTAVHATGMVHGNVHPGTVLIGDDGRVVLADARADSADSTESDVRAVGGILYYALTAHWPHAEVGRSTLPDAMRDGSDNIVAPRQIRAGVPAYLDDLTMDLTDKRVATPEADALTAELARLNSRRRGIRGRRPAALHPGHLIRADPQHPQDRDRHRRARGDRGDRPGLRHPGDQQLGQRQADGHHPGRRGAAGQHRRRPRRERRAGHRRPASRAEEDPADRRHGPHRRPAARPARRHRRGGLHGRRRQEHGLEDRGLQPAQVRQLQGRHGRPDQPGLPARRSATSASRPRCPASAWTSAEGTSDPGNNSQGDEKVVKDFKRLSDGDIEKTDGTNENFIGFSEDQKYQYILVWLSELPQDGDGRYRIEVSKIEVWGN